MTSAMLEPNPDLSVDAPRPRVSCRHGQDREMKLKMVKRAEMDGWRQVAELKSSADHLVLGGIFLQKREQLFGILAELGFDRECVKLVSALKPNDQVDLGKNYQDLTAQTEFIPIDRRGGGLTREVSQVKIEPKRFQSKILDFERTATHGKFGFRERTNDEMRPSSL